MKKILVVIAAAALVSGCAAMDPFGQNASRLYNTMPTMRAEPDHTVWTMYRTFRFDQAATGISSSDMPKVAEIVAYLHDNPSFDVAIDGTQTAPDTSDADRVLGARRATSVRRAIMDSGVGVASYKIVSGPCADPALRRAGQVQVLVGQRSGKSAAERRANDGSSQAGGS